MRRPLRVSRSANSAGNVLIALPYSADRSPESRASGAAKPALERRARALYSPAPRRGSAQTREPDLSTALERSAAKAGGERIAYALMLLAPAMFASNLLAARAAADTIPPVALGFWRWLVAALILMPAVAKPLWRARRALRREAPDLFVLGALGMGVCGAVLYLGAQTTTATNLALIYASSPVLIILLARVIYGEPMSARQATGVGIALVGVVAIVARGDAWVLLGLQFTPGDLCVVAASVAWAIYTVLLLHRPTALAATPRLAAIALAGVALMFPFLVLEGALGHAPRLDLATVGWVLLVAIVPGLGAYQTYDFVQRRLGANRTSLIMYLIPLYATGLAWLLLGETLEPYHFAGAALVLPGIYLATRRPGS
jgi:drug/metabolite transporter (DMT)-like permease